MTDDDTGTATFTRLLIHSKEVTVRGVLRKPENWAEIES